jgi:hypothetical protein
LLQRLVPSLSVNSHSVHRLRTGSALNRSKHVENYNVICIYNTVNKLGIKLVIETSLHYDARSEKHQIICLCLDYKFTLAHNR